MLAELEQPQVQVQTKVIEITTDFETYWDDQYSLTKMTTIEYVTDERFKVHMLGVIHEEQPTTAYIIKPDEIAETVEIWKQKQQAGHKIHMTCQNTMFDGFILWWHYDFVADFYYDTRAMSKGLWPHEKAGLKDILVRLFPDDPTLRKGEELESSKGIRDLSPELFTSIKGYCANDCSTTLAAKREMLPMFPAGELPIIDLLTRMFCDPVFQLDRPLIERYIPHLENYRIGLIAKSGLHTFAETYNLVGAKKPAPQMVKEYDKELRKGNTTPELREFFLSLKILNSNKAFVAWLNSMQIDVPMKWNDENTEQIPALGQKDLGYQALVREHPELRDVWAARKVAKSVITLSRAKRYLDVANRLGGHMPISLLYSAAHTHRLGGGEKQNAQNMPRNAADDHPDGDLRPGALRRSLLAPEGYACAVGDLSNIEARLLAVIAGAWHLVDIFRNNGDVYSHMASKIYNRMINKKTDPFERNVGKVTVLGLGYGMGRTKFQDTLNSGPMGMDPIYFDDPSMYGYIVNIYRTENWQIPAFWQQCTQFLFDMTMLETDYQWGCLRIQHERIVLPGGLALQYPNLRSTSDGFCYDGKDIDLNAEDGDDDEDGRRVEKTVVRIYGGKLCENIVQALAQVIIKDAMLRAHRRLQDAFGGLSRIALQVHDEIVGIAPLERANEALAIMLEEMTRPVEWMPELPLAAEGDWALNYSK